MFSADFYLDLEWQTPLATGGVDDWLTGCFGFPAQAGGVTQGPDVPDWLPVSSIRGEAVGESSAADGSLCLWLLRALVLQPVLLQAARVPLFQPSVITAAWPPAADRPSWRVFFSYRLRFALTPALLRESLVNTILAVRWMAGHAVAVAAHRAHLFRVMETEWLGPLRQQQMAGGSTLPLLRAADRLQLPVEDLGYGLYQFGWGHHSVRLHRSVTSRDSAQGGWVTRNKAWTQTMLKAGGFPGTDAWRVRHANDALRAVRHLGWPVVVKPVDRERGEGVTTRIDSESELLVALERAFAAGGCREALVEGQVEGFCHRLLVARGQLLYVIERRPPELVGDGQRSLVSLMDQHNECLSWVPPWKMEQPLAMDAEMLAYIAGQGYAPSSVPGVGVAVSLRPFESMAWGGKDADLTASIHPDNRRLAERVTAFLGLDVAGIDLISRDIRVPWHENGAKINEVNFAPMLGMWPLSEAYLPEFFRRYCPAGGRIPLRLFCGDALAWARARQCQVQALQAGSPVYLTRRDETLCPDGQPWQMTGAEVGERCRALLLNEQVAAVYVVVNDADELGNLRWIDRWDAADIVTEQEEDRRIWSSALTGLNVLAVL